ncbi:hypothetical protein BKA56DRAFT_616883 [Ilyonectria sp. MPI-CAGE-AT-0026]|nr:hypothetical protein BKA56DRAFT_616883 [Ilyonectria sp. MPI-CAGE-AT-0026]
MAGQSTGAPKPLGSITLWHRLSSLSLVCCFGVVNVYTSEGESAPRPPTTSFSAEWQPAHLTSHTSVKFRKRATLKKLSEAEDLVVRQRFACSLTSAISGAWLGATTRLTGGGRGGPWTGPPVGMVQCLSSLKMVARRAVPVDALSPSSSDSYGN